MTLDEAIEYDVPEGTASVTLSVTYLKELLERSRT